jgi:hypothetical protein
VETTIVDLRYKTKEILKALERNERVKILYHGKVKGIITSAKTLPLKSVKEHKFFGMSKNREDSVSEVMEDLRGPRY